MENFPTFGEVFYLLYMKQSEENTALGLYEKLALCGADSLSDAELLSVILSNGSQKVIDTASDLLSAAGGSLLTLSSTNPDVLASVRGMTRNRMSRLSALFTLFGRFCSAPFTGMPVIGSSADAVAIIAPRLRSLAYEECWIMLLNRANRLVATERMSIGGVHSTTIDIKMILKKALEHLASSIILIHNHPSGSAEPGQADLSQTKALRDAAATLDICLVDHLIIAGRKYYSFADEQSREP